jgi:CRISPR-associated protein (TIGR02584 family)
MVRRYTMPAFRDILVAVVGLTPQIITETIYYRNYSAYHTLILREAALTALLEKE